MNENWRVFISAQATPRKRLLSDKESSCNFFSIFLRYLSFFSIGQLLGGLREGAGIFVFFSYFRDAIPHFPIGRFAVEQGKEQDSDFVFVGIRSGKVLGERRLGAENRPINDSVE